MKALVVFWDPPDARWQWLLRPGFRHVFCALNDGKAWITVDARDGRPAVDLAAAVDFDLAHFYRSEGYTVIELEQGPPIGGLFAVANCVGLVKRILCIDAWWVLSPYQLYRHLEGRTCRTISGPMANTA